MIDPLERILIESSQRRDEVVRQLGASEINCYEAIHTGSIDIDVMHKFIEKCVMRGFYYIMRHRHIPVTSDVGEELRRAFNLKNIYLSEVFAKVKTVTDADLAEARSAVLAKMERYDWGSPRDEVCSNYISTVSSAITGDPYEALSSIPLGHIRNEDINDELQARNEILYGLMQDTLAELPGRRGGENPPEPKVEKESELLTIMAARKNTSEW